MNLTELSTMHDTMVKKVELWNTKDCRITTAALEALRVQVGHPLSRPETGIAVAIFKDESEYILGLSWTIRLGKGFCSATIIDPEIRGQGYGGCLFKFKVALFKHRVRNTFPTVMVNPNNKASHRMVEKEGVKIRETRRVGDES